MAGITRKYAASPLGEAISAARDLRGVSQRRLGALIGQTSAGLVSRWESGERTPSVDDVQAIIDALEIEGEEADRLLALAAGVGQPRRFSVTLPERRAELAELLAAERTATEVTHLAPLVIPGVLQTADAIRTQMHEAGVPESEIEERVLTRIGRRDLITRRNPARLEVVLGEAAIRYRIGGPAVWADQLQYLMEMGELPNVELRLVPYSAGWSPLLVGSFTLIESDQAPPIVSLELHGSGLTLRSPEDIARHRRAADAVREKAMSPASTVELIAEVRQELEQG
ncbi:helix-turn-helix transcriptional regulator [Amycolatopsis sp. NPDC024027]|uniref:helix-turn-helix domain-containing protein n=1 Tax=Amycolatopsis sp. NPDC024027 TaxID=3154327 RepID=UPI0033DD7633